MRTVRHILWGLVMAATLLLSALAPTHEEAIRSLLWAILLLLMRIWMAIEDKP